VNASLGFWANFKSLLRSKYSNAEAERLFAAFQQLHEEWFKSLSLADLDSIAASVEQELGVAFEAPE
jgi:ppGpp synthetase/RelA/SpoT-type nucleotidyltranferase